MKKILIIEDDPIIADLYRTRLESATCSVETCHNGRSGLERINEVNPDAILLDLMLPGMNGIELLKKFRAQSKFASIPIVVFTNAYLPNMIEAATAAGASRVYNKATLTPKQLLDCFGFPENADKPSNNPSPSPTGTASVPSAIFVLDDHPGSPPPPANYGYEHNHGGTSHLKPQAPQAAAQADPSFFDSECYRTFVAGKPEMLEDLRSLLQKVIKPLDEAARDQHMVELYRKVHALTARASLAKFADIAGFSAALEVLLKELHEQPKRINVSTLRTVAQSVDFIGELFSICEPRVGDLPAPKILVVDDEVLSRRAIVYALEKGDLKSTDIDDATAALTLISEEQFDLIVLDIQMPGIDGFELCERIRSLPINRTTPVLFVTGLTDFKNRARATVSGGTDFVAKPFYFIEVTIKATTLILRNRLRLLARAKAA